MSAIVIVLIGFGAGLLTMTVVSMYKYFLKIWNNEYG